ncbi:MAG: biliverdin-producing heme oxygenase [Novosphingobium sp.]
MTDILDPSRARRLRALTSQVHQELDDAIMAAASFDSLAGYGRFAAMQYRFHRDIAPLYADPALAAVLPGLPDRAALALVAADLADLGESPPPEAAPVFAGEIDLPTALGWLYVAEGSRMGAALLRKEAAKLGLSDAHGARHLAPAPEGPAAHWRAFTAALDAPELTAAEEERVVAGARAAFARVRGHAEAAFA